MYGATKSRNYGGSCRSNSRKSLGSPIRSGALIQEQMNLYHQAGERENQALLRAKAA